MPSIRVGRTAADSASPLIVTLVLDPAATAWFDTLRTAHFPPERLAVGAHVTMFHALPGSREPDVAACLATRCAGASPFGVRVSGLRFLGHGVAFSIECPQAAALRAQLAQAFAGELTRQDKAAWSPHVTVQNKVSADRARQTLAELSGLIPPHAIATGLALWRYRGGPWEAVRRFGFERPGDGLSPDRLASRATACG